MYYYVDVLKLACSHIATYKYVFVDANQITKEM